METKNSESFENEHVKVKAQRGTKCRVTFDVEVSPVATEAAYQKAIKEVAKNVSIPGFRKGKAPANLITDSFGQSIDKEFRDLAIDTAVKEAINLSKIYPFQKAKFDAFKLHHLAREKGGHFTVSFETYPVIPEINLKKVPVFEIPEEPVDEKRMAAIVDQVRHHHATWNQITDRPAQEGDYVTLSICTVEQPVREVCKEKTFKLSTDEIAEWMQKAIVGMKTGDTVETTSEKPASKCGTGCNDPKHHHDHSHDDNFVPTLCAITLNAIHVPTLPEVDEALAKKLGCDTVEQFHQKSREYAEASAKKLQRTEQRNAMYEYLRDNYSFDVPGQLVEKDVEEYVKSCTDELSPEDRTEAALATIEREANVLQDELTKRVYTEFLTGSLASRYNLQVTQQEIAEDVFKELIQNNLYQDKQNLEKHSEMISQRVARDRLIEKALDYLIDHAGKENP